MTRTTLSAIAALAAVTFLQACSVSEPEKPQTQPVGLPSGIVLTDGSSAIPLLSPGQASCVRTTASDAATALARTNAQRARRGLAPLQTHPTLQRAAERHACDMAQRGSMTHTGSATSGPSARVKALGYRPRVTAENIGAGHLSLDKVLETWGSSSGHAANIMHPRMRDFGIGRAVGPDGKTTFWTAVYAAQ